MADPTTVPTGIQPNLPAALSELGAALLLPALLVAVIAYFCGCFNGAVIVSKYILRDDAIMIDWRIALVVWGGFLILAALTKWVSLGSIWAGASFPFATWFVYHDVVLLALAILLGGLIVWKHRGNLKRILNGTESKFSLHHKKDEGAPKA